MEKDMVNLDTGSRETLEAVIGRLQQENAKLKQQLEDSALELQATVDEFMRTDAERKRLISDIDEYVRVDLERKRLIKELQAAKRLADENSRLKSEFLSTMSHELRTPLNAIEGFTGIILNRIGGTDYNPKTEGYLNRIRSNSRRLLQLINDFLDLSRVEAGRLELANMSFSPQKLAERWQGEISVLAEKKNLKFEVSLDELAARNTLRGRRIGF